MAIAAAVKKFLDGQGIRYQIANHERTKTLEEAASTLGINEQQIARSVLLRDDLGIVMAVLPVTHRLDFKRLKKLLQRDLQVVSGKDADKIFIDCEPGSRPPVAEAYGVACVVDSSLSLCEDIYFEPGAHNSLVHVSYHDFQDMLAAALKGQFAYQVSTSSVALHGKGAHTRGASTCFSNNAPYLNMECLKRCIHDRYKLPNTPLLFDLLAYFNGDKPLPVAKEIVAKLTANPMMAEMLLANANLLATMRKEQSYQSVPHLFSKQQSPEVIKTALAMAIGVLGSQAFYVHVTGPFANKIIWRHSLYAAIIAQKVAQMSDPRLAISRHEAFLAALVQNIGVLLLGYLFPPEYHLLNRLALAYPGMSMEVIERKMLGMGKAHDVVALGHERLGAWLLKSWHFPESSCTVAGEHHNPLLDADANPYLLVVMLVNTLLSEYGYEQLVQRGDIDVYLSALGLTPDQLEPLQDHLIRLRPIIERLLRQV